MGNRKRKPYEGTINRHGRRFRANYYIRGDLKRESFFTEQEAKDFLIKMTNAKHRGRLPSMANLRMDRLFDLVLTDLRNNRRRSIADAKSRIDTDLLPRFSGMKVTDFRGSDIEDYKAERLAEDPTPAPATINRELSLLRKGFSLAYQKN